MSVPYLILSLGLCFLSQGCCGVFCLFSIINNIGHLATYIFAFLSHSINLFKGNF